MKQWICIRPCFSGKKWKINEIREAEECPSPHFREYSPVVKETAEDILDKELKAKGIKIKPEWTFAHKQHILDKTEETKKESGERELMLKELEEADIRVHPNIGMEKLREKHEKFVLERGAAKGSN